MGRELDLFLHHDHDMAQEISGSFQDYLWDRSKIGCFDVLDLPCADYGVLEQFDIVQHMGMNFVNRSCK